MEAENKLKPTGNAPIIFGLLSGIVLCMVFAFIWIRFGENTVDKIGGLILTMSALIVFGIWIRTRNTGYLVYFLLNGFMAIRLLLGFTDPTLVFIYRVILVALILFFLYFLITKRMNWHYRKILELAAKPVDGTADGFTPRPFPVGEAKYTRKEIIQLGKFLAKHLIAYPYVEKNRIIMVISTSELKDIFLLRKTYINDTFVSFDFDGRVTVNIAKKEYDKYKEEFTFDELCASLGSLFIDFVKLFQKGDKNKILERIKNK